MIRVARAGPVATNRATPARIAALGADERLRIMSNSPHG
jgi:hypothetical protein